MNQRLLAIVCVCFVLLSLAGPSLLKPSATSGWKYAARISSSSVMPEKSKRGRRRSSSSRSTRYFAEWLTVAQGHPSPVIIIFAMKDEKSLSDLLPEYWTKGHMHPAGLFAYRMNQYYAAVNLEAQGTNPFATMYHEYYHSLTLPYFPELPTWLAEGLADFSANRR